MKGPAGLYTRLLASRHLDRWATPSVLPDLPKFTLDLDQSISNRRLGSPLEHNEAFAVLEATVAAARGARRAWPLTNGSTLANQIAMFALTRQFARPRVLAAANTHHSVINAASTYGVDFRYLTGHVLTGFDALLPPVPGEIAAALDADPQITVVWISSPTYEGVAADIPGIVAVAHARSVAVIVDAAWGAHFGYHPDLPDATATLGADLVIESIHKNGGGLQGSAALLHAGDYIDPDAVEFAFSTLTSTSPSFLVLASLGIALEQLHADGKRYLEIPLRHASELRDGLIERGLPVLSHPALVDATKVTFAGLPGFQVETHLDKRGIVIEKASPYTAMLLATMQLSAGASGRALQAVDELLERAGEVAAPPCSIAPVGWLAEAPVIEPHCAVRARNEVIPLADSVGRIAGQLIELYPPGIPVLAPGWRITQRALDTLESAHRAGAHVVPADIQSVAVLVDA